MDEETIRLYLHSLLTATFPDLKVYYRPSGNMQLTRPCIVYEQSAANPSFANNDAFVVGSRFQITFLSDLPGLQDISRKVYGLSGVLTTSNRSYVSEDIVHSVYTVSVHSIS